MDLIIGVATFIISIAVLVKASDYFIRAAEKIGVFLRIPHFVIGVFVLGFGTSFPELVSSIFAVVKSSSEIVIGNVLGSNITNIFLVLGAAAVSVKIEENFSIEHNLMRFDLPMLLGSSFMLALMIWDQDFSNGDAVICLLCLAIYFLYTFFAAPKEQNKECPDKKGPGYKAWVQLLASPVFILLGAKYTIEAVVSISEIIGIGTEVIALSAVALGTSLPEVVVAVSAVRRGNHEMAVGNIIGSNIFNTYAVMSISAFFGPLLIPKGVLTFSLPVSIFATLLFIIMTIDNKVGRWEGWFLLVFYVFFVGKLFGWV